MIALKEANYLGKVEQLKHTNGIVASITSYPDSRYSENLHYHETLHLSFILQGGNLEKRVSYDIERLPGTVTYYDAGEPHQSTATLPGSRHVNLEITDHFLQKADMRIHAAGLEGQKHPDAKFLMLKIYKELLWGDADAMLSMEAAVFHLLHLSLKKEELKVPPAWAYRVKELLHDRWNEKLTLDELAEVAGLHPANVSGYFTRLFGCTIGEYRRKIKIEKALPLIQKSDHSLTDIAFLCDFSDQSHFIRAFKEATGWTPKTYRQINPQ